MIRQSLSCAALFLLASACRRESEIETYRVPKESAPAPVRQADPHAGMPMPGGSGGGDPHAAMPQGGKVVEALVAGELPESWEPAPGSSMRLASYRVAGEDGALADVSLSVLGGDAGGVADNVNRWRGQVGLAREEESALLASAVKLDTPVGEALAFDMDGATTGVASPTDGRILAAIVPREGEVWFYKMRGNPDLVGREKAGFLRWVETAAPKVSAPAEPAAEPLPAGPPGGVTWQAPADWRQLPGDTLRLAAFATGGGGEVTVIRLGGSGGGELANVNRWRGQLALDPIADLAGVVETVQAGGIAMSLVDMTGSGKRTVAAWSQHDGATWYFKLTGPSAAVDAQRGAFVAFVQTVKFDNP